MSESKAENLWVHFRLGRYFQPGSHKTAISVPELVAQTNSFSVKNRPGCKPTLETSNPRDLALGYNVKCSLENSDPNGHDVKVHFDLSQVEDETSAKNLDVAVKCSCLAFLYWGGQWNTHQRDALEGEPRALLTAPTERLDLREGFVICKHIKAVSERILPSVQFNINNILRKRHVEEYKTEHPEAPARGPHEEHQERMRERQEKRRQQRPEEKALNEKFRSMRPQGIDDVVKRDTPATPEEKLRVPELAPESVPAPDAHKQHEALPPVPEIEGLEEPATEKGTPPAVEEANPRTAPKPNSRSGPQQWDPKDREQMNRLMREERKRRDRETQQRMRNNPAFRR